MPIGAALRELLADVRPRGVITQLRTRWDGPLDAPARYRVKGQLSGLSLAAHPAPDADGVGRPGPAQRLAPARGDRDRRPGAHRHRSPARLELPGVFDEREVPLDRLDAQAALEDRAAENGAAPKLSVKVRVGELRQRRRQGRADRDLAHRAPATASAAAAAIPGQLELDGKLVDGVAARTARYLPLGLPRGVRSYVAGAVRGGTIASATFRVRGDLWDFPFHDAQGRRATASSASPRRSRA